MPNTVHAIDAGGIVVFRAMWNDPDAVVNALRLMRSGQDPRSVPARFRPTGVATLLRVLQRAGRQALWDFAKVSGKLVWAHLARRSP